ncbi:MAG: GSCFA domain-containing protein [Flavobacteriales bacterium]|nr:GSCFA domain-containing protein [Flavobacteriales bacterium]
MKFKIDFSPPIQPIINYKIPIMAIGSCFSENMAKNLANHCFKVCNNPNGIVYNPISIAASLQRALQMTPYSENDLVFLNDVWYSWHHHGCHSHTDRQMLINKINKNQSEMIDIISKPKVNIIVTLGSAWVYEKYGEVVANCHKFPANHFQKRMLQVDEIVGAFSQVINRSMNAQYLFTVSPVRYVRDGLHENNLSKSVLHLAVQQLVSQYDNCFYFPSYEIVMDELRDYRFFEKDFVHPNNLAIEYVWERFCENVLDEETKEMVHLWKPILVMKNHVLLNQNTAESKKFLNQLEQREKEFNKKFFA